MKSKSTNVVRRLFRHLSVDTESSRSHEIPQPPIIDVTDVDADKPNKSKRPAFLTSSNWAPNTPDIELIRSTWSSDQTFLIEFGLEVNMFLFRTMPSVKTMFSRVLGEDANSSEYEVPQVTHRLRVQALRLAEVIDYVVTNIDAVNKMNDYLHDIGRAHQAIVGTDLKPDHWQLMKDGLEMAINKMLTMDNRFSALPPYQIDSALTAWRHLMVYISRKVYIGFVTRKASVTNSITSRDMSAQKRLSLSFVSLSRNVDT